MTHDALTEQLDRLLPQTQCRQCGFDGCRAYAQALAQSLAPVNRCAPGGARGIAALAQVLGTPALPLDPEYGHEAPFAVARIDAARCIGCRLCAQACPVDAVSGAPKRLFAVIDSLCTGCALCLPACPMDCMRMVETEYTWTEQDALSARDRYRQAQTRRLNSKTALDRAAAIDEQTKQTFLNDVMAQVRRLSEQTKPRS